MISEYGASQWAAIMFGLADPPAALYVALCTDEPGEGWDGTLLAAVEPDPAAGYARQAVALPSGWAASDGGFVTNASTIAFPTPTDDWGQITHWALADAATGGELWAAVPFSDSLAVPASSDVSLAVGALVIALGEALVSIADT